MTDQEQEQIKYRDRIIKEFFNSGVMQRKCESICWKNRIQKESLIHEDVCAEMWYYLSKKSPALIIELYEDDKRRKDGRSRLEGLATTIAVLKGVATNATNRNYYKHSVARYILYQSSFQQHEYIDSNEVDEQSEFAIVATQQQEENKEEELWELISSELTVDENEFLQTYLMTKKKTGKLKREVQAQLDHLKQRIKEIVEKHKIKI